MITTLERAIGWAILHAVWQNIFIGVAAWLYILQAPSAQARYRAAFASLLASFGVFVLSVAVYVFPMQAPPVMSALLAPALQPFVLRPSFARLDVIRFTGMAWVLCVSVAALRTLGGWLFARHAYVARATPAAAQWQARVQRIAEAQRVCAPRVLQSSDVDSPAVFGTFRPVLILPAAGLSGLDDAQVDGIIVHELTHIERRDGVANLVQCLIDLVFFFHPVVRWLSRFARAEREHICDARAAATCGGARPYISALLLLEETRCYAARMVLSARAGTLVGRVRRLIAPRRMCVLPGALLRYSASAVLVLVMVGTVVLAPSMRALTNQLLTTLNYTVTASDPAGPFTLSFDRGVAVRATLHGAAVPTYHLRQSRDSVFILDSTGRLALALQVRPGGISWSPRRTLTSL